MLQEMNYCAQLIVDNDSSYYSFTKSGCATINILTYGANIIEQLQFFDSLKHLYCITKNKGTIRIRMDLISDVYARKYYLKDMEYPCL